MSKLPSIPGYKIDRCVGKGAMGSVYRAEQLSLGRRVALKVMHASLIEQDHKFAERFKREATTTASLRHPNIITVHDTGEYGGLCYLAMDFIEGGSLRDLLERGALGHRQAFRICARVASGLANAHAAGFVHRDIKPENILLEPGGNPVITDFGIVKVTWSGTELTGTNTVGSPSYMSPEQLMGVADLDGRADLYSLGVVLFEMLEGHKPFESDAPFGVGMLHLNEAPPPLGEGNALFQPIVTRLLEKNPEKRYQNAGELLSSLREIRDDLARGSRPVPARAAPSGPSGDEARTQVRSRPKDDETRVRHAGRQRESPASLPPRPGRWSTDAPALSPGIAATSLHGGRQRRLLDDAPVADPKPPGSAFDLVGRVLRSRLFLGAAGIVVLWLLATLLVPGLRLGTLDLELRGLVGDAAAQREVARRFDLLGNTPRMRFWLRRAARGGLPGASYDLGMSYYRDQEEARAIEAFEDEGAEPDSYSELAELMLAETLCNGRAVESCRRAERILKRVVDAHASQRAMHKLGEIHLFRLSPPDHAEAIAWFRRTIEAEGSAVPRSPEATDAMLQLAALHAAGLGVPADRHAAARLLALAARSPVAGPDERQRAREACAALAGAPAECSALADR